MSSGTSDVIYLTLLELAILLTAAEAFKVLIERYYLPSLIGELLVGIILSPYALGGIINSLFHVDLFQINSYLTFFAEFSVILLIFASGLAHGFKGLKSSGFIGFLAATFGALIPFVLVYFIFKTIYPLQITMLMAAASAATSLAASAAIVEEFKLYKMGFAKIMISAAALDDVVSLIILTTVLQIESVKVISFLEIVYSTAIMIVSWVIILLLSVLIIPRVISRVRDELVNPFSLFVLFLLVFLMLLLGFSPIIASFIAGLAIAESVKSSKISSFTSALLAVFGPVFFIYVGLETPISTFTNVNDLLLGLLLTLLASIGKIAGIFPFSFIYTKSIKESFLASIGMIPRGELGLVIATLGLSSSVFTVHEFSQVVIMALLTTIIGGILFTYLVKKWVVRVEKQ